MPIRKRLCYAILLSFSFVQFAFSQDFLRFKGKVVEEGSNALVPFVTVQIKGVALGTITEEDGSFAVKIPIKYKSDTLVFSSVGFEKLEYAISNLQQDSDNLIVLKQSVVELEEVTVTRGKRKKPLKLLKAAIAKIPENYPTQNFTFDAYYRERIIENGGTIKFADAATTFQQGPYIGEAKSKRKAFKSYIRNFSSSRQGIVIGGQVGMFSFIPAGERLHDHFSQYTSGLDRVKIHDARASLNLTREKLTANIEGGPLSTLNKDIVHNLGLFMYKRKFGKYVYELVESPDENGNWYYVVKFSPRKAPETLEKIRARRAKDKITSRTHILSGSIWIDQESLAIKRTKYRVERDYRRHICNLQEQNIKHYGYEVETNYQQVGERWQLADMTRIDEFIFKDTIANTTTPYSTITEIFVTNPQSDLKEVPGRENFLNVQSNSLYEFPLEYNPEFWEKYQSDVGIAVISDDIRKDMETVNLMEEQFSLKHLRNDSLPAPVAPVITTTVRLHGESLKDDYSWMKDTRSPRTNGQIMDYLIEENQYADNYFIPLRKTEREVLNKLYRHIDQESESEPTKSNGYWYWSKYEGDNDYRTIYRKKDKEGAKEEVLWDLQALAEEKDYFNLDFYLISPDNRYMAYAIDTTGQQNPMTYVKDLKSGSILADSLRNTGSFLWTDDSNGFFYSNIDEKTNRSYEIKYHRLGDKLERDSTWFSTKEAGANLGIWRSESKEFLYVNSSVDGSDQVWLARNKAPFNFQIVREREKGVRYGLSHVKSQFYISTNKDAPNMKLMSTDTASVSFENWREVVPASTEVVLSDFAIFDNFLVTLKKEQMKKRIEVTNLLNSRTYVIQEKKVGDVYDLSLGSNIDKSSDTLRYFVSAPDYKTHKVAYHMGTRKSVRKPAQKLNQEFSLMKYYNTKLVWADARDGTKIPVSLVFYGKNEKFITRRPLYVEAYGAYGISSSLGFDKSKLILLEGGFSYAYVHVRGGGDLGEQWYEQGKMENKMNSFTDLIDAVEYLTSNGYGDPNRVFAGGGSAGGLLMGGVVNQRPDLFQGVLLDVPFVDVINTMLDESLPLTVGEFTEWGNPKKKAEFRNILTYSPYENVKAQNYPRMAYYAGLNDKNVGYWEAAKMVARLRANKLDDNILLLRTNFSAGHGPSSGRTAAYGFIAYKYALLFEWLREVNQDLHREKLVKKP